MREQGVIIHDIEQMVVPDQPTILFKKGDGTDPDIRKATRPAAQFSCFDFGRAVIGRL